MTEDPNLRLAMARRAYAIAIARRDAITPGDAGYHDAVLEVGLRWSQVRYWERRIGPVAAHDAPADHPGRPSSADPPAGTPGAAPEPSLSMTPHG